MRSVLTFPLYLTFTITFDYHYHYHYHYYHLVHNLHNRALDARDFIYFLVKVLLIAVFETWHICKITN